MATYPYASLTLAIRDKASPIRQYLDQRYPNTKPLQADYRARSGSLRVDGGDARPGLMGTGFDLQLRFLLDPKARGVQKSKLRRGSQQGMLGSRAHDGRLPSRASPRLSDSPASSRGPVHQR
jgi:hypothetical protein